MKILVILNECKTLFYLNTSNSAYNKFRFNFSHYLSSLHSNLFEFRIFTNLGFVESEPFKSRIYRIQISSIPNLSNRIFSNPDGFDIESSVPIRIWYMPRYNPKISFYCSERKYFCL